MSMAILMKESGRMAFTRGKRNYGKGTEIVDGCSMYEGGFRKAIGLAQALAVILMEQCMRDSGLMTRRTGIAKSTILMEQCVRYEGQYADNKSHGNGTCHLTDGAMYKGQRADG